MQVAPPTPDEGARLRLLRALDLLDTEPEEAFDAITRLLAQLLDVPIALLSLVDNTRQWFKSRVGLEASETPRAVAFCAHAIHGEGPFIVRDAHADPRFSDNPLVTGAPHVSFYAGIPLRSAEGHALGTLCAIDHVPRDLTARQIRLLGDLAAMLRRELLNREAALAARAVAAENLRVVAQRAALYHATFDRAAVGIAVLALDGHFVMVNPELCRIVGRTAEELQGLTPRELTHPEDCDLGDESLHRLLNGQTEHYTLEKRYVRLDGTVVWVHAAVSLIRLDDRPDHVVAVIADIDARRASEQAVHELTQQLEQRVQLRTAELEQANEKLRQSMLLREASQAQLARSEASLRAVLDSALDAFVGVDADGAVVHWNRQAEAIFGWPAREAIGRPLVSLILSPDSRHADSLGLCEDSAQRGRRLELAARRRDGSTFPCEVSVTALAGADPRQQRIAAFMRDISERKELERRLAAAALTDELTGLPNRRAFEAQAAGALARARRSGEWVALFFMDLDRFKAINDTHGHAAGDLVLKAFATRLLGAVRSVDLVARLAGDEFVVMLEQIDPREPAHVLHVAQKIVTAIGRPLDLASGAVQMQASIGIAVDSGEAPLERLLQQADAALYRAKQGGRNGVCLADVSDQFCADFGEWRTMDQFVWEEYFETGLADVDARHHGIVDLINRFGELLLRPRDVAAGELSQVLDELAHYAQLHFSEEEQLMTARRLDPRHIELHIVKHANFLGEVRQRAAEIADHPGPSAMRLFEFLVSWLAFHILGTDQSMARQIAAIDAGATAKEAYRSADELSDPATAALLRSMNRLFWQISDRNRELFELNRSLEERVAQRTEELLEANRRLEAQALTDMLTGLPNRRIAVRRLDAEWAETAGGDATLACIVIDADGFKQINDSFGHDAGDEVLRQLALRLSESVRSDDTVCRMGGDEFLVICSHTPLSGALKLAEGLRRSVGALQVAVGSGAWHGSISCGVAVREAWMTGPNDLLKSADDGLYLAKRNGRNCVATAARCG